MKRIGILSAAFAALLTVACGGDDRRNDANAPANDTAAVGTAGTEANRDANRNANRDNDAGKTWLQDRMKDNLAEIKLGELAQKKAQNADVKAYGKMMVQEHTKANNELKQIATKQNVEPPMDPGPDHSKTADDLQQRQGAEFDRAYADAMVDGHQDVLDALESRVDKSGDDKMPSYTAKKSDDPIDRELNQWAATTAPNVRKHLERAKQLKDRLDRRTTDNNR
jgi:putative membrane protein